MRLRLFFALLFLSFHTAAQIKDYLNENSIFLDSDELNFDSRFYENQVYFFGFIHGCEMPQEMDFRLLNHLSTKGVKYYSPEVDVSLAFFLNKYLDNGDEDLLHFIVHFYDRRVPQDASIQFKDKWRKIYKLNQTFSDENKIQIIGFDQIISKELSLTHLAYLSKNMVSDNPIITGLREFAEISFKELHIRSGQPARKSGKGWEYFFGNEKTEHFNKLQNQYNENPHVVTDAFGEYGAIADEILRNKQTNREETIFENFSTRGKPIIERGGKIYCNYGYFHIQQDLINKQPSIAAMIKKNTPYKVVSIQGLLYDSECLKGPKLCFDKKIDIKGVKFDKMNYCGYKTSKTWDGDWIFERVNGIKYLKKFLKNNSSALINLENETSPFKEEMWFANFKRGGRHWRVEPNKVTTDYFQYIIIMKNSKPNNSYVEDL